MYVGGLLYSLSMSHLGVLLSLYVLRRGLRPEPDEGPVQVGEVQRIQWGHADVERTPHRLQLTKRQNLLRRERREEVIYVTVHGTCGFFFFENQRIN